MYFSSKFLNGSGDNNREIDIDKIKKFNKKKKIILPLGSCFLDNFSKELNSKKFNICSNPKLNTITNDAYRFFFGNFDNPSNLLDNLERIVLKKWKFKDSDFIYSEKFDHYINFYLKARYKTKKLKDIKKRIQEMDKYLLNEIHKSSVILLSFDTIETWVDKISKKAWYTFYGDYFSQKTFANKAKLKTLNYEDLMNIMKKIIKILDKVGNKKEFIIMASPQNLGTTYLNKDIKIADLYSKSTFISVFTDLVSKNVSYFPAFEIINNLNKTKRFRGDNVHILQKTIRNCLSPYFEKLFF